MIDFACKQFKLDEIIKCGLGLSKADYTIFTYLIEHDEWFTTTSLAEKLNLDTSTVQRSIKKLHEKEVVQRIQNNRQSGGYVFVYKAQGKAKIRIILTNIINSWAEKTTQAIQNW